MEIKQCYLCHSNSIEIIHKGTRDKPDIDVLKCTDCGLIFLSDFLTNDQDYEESKMHDDENDISEWIQETMLDDIRRFEYCRKWIAGKSILDFGCGNGNFLKIASQITRTAHGVELEKRAIKSINSWGGGTLL